MKLPPGHVAGQGVVKPKCTGGFGERMLRSMGWEAGKGLGKEGQGMKEAIQVKKKEDTVGVSSPPAPAPLACCRLACSKTLPAAVHGDRDSVACSTTGWHAGSLLKLQAL